MLATIQSFTSVQLVAATATVGTLLEIILRLVPSQKPLGVLISVAAIVTNISNFLNKVVPQNLSK